MVTQSVSCGRSWTCPRSPPPASGGGPGHPGGERLSAGMGSIAEARSGSPSPQPRTNRPPVSSVSPDRLSGGFRGFRWDSGPSPSPVGRTDCPPVLAVSPDRLSGGFCGFPGIVGKDFAMSGGASWIHADRGEVMYPGGSTPNRRPFRSSTTTNTGPELTVYPQTPSPSGKPGPHPGHAKLIP